jgi:hypothetical protein
MNGKTCGACVHTEAAGETVVWCYGAPPTVLSATSAVNGGLEVKVQAPLVPNERRACAMFAPKRKPRRKAAEMNSGAKPKVLRPKGAVDAA